MRVCAVSMAYNDEDVIKGTLRCLQPFVDTHVIMLSEKPFFGEGELNDRTEEICDEHGAVVVRGVWEEHKQRNIGTKICGDCDWIICFDSDEMMTAADMEKFLQILADTEEGAVAAHSEVYWKTTDYRLRPSPDHKIIVAIKPTTLFWDKRSVNCNYKVLSQDEVIHHHLSWCAPKDIYKKVTNYNHANEFDGERWYKNIYEKWEQGMPAIEPFGTKFGTTYKPLPTELLKHLYD